MHRRKLALLLLASIAAVAGGGSAVAQNEDVPDPQIADGTEQRRLDSARGVWRGLGIDSYSFRVQRQCFCPTDVTKPRVMVVRKGRPVGKIPSHLRAVATVPRLHKMVQEAIDKEVARLDVRYGARGVPTHVYIDRSFRIADEEDAYLVDRFHRR
jgi:hypothetical protein